MEQVIDVKEFTAAIAGDRPTGEDMSFSAEFDTIKEARRAEEDLPQDEWQRDIKLAEWPSVKQMAADLLMNKTKDLQLCAWLTEALTQLHGFPGLYAGLTVTREIVATFWDHLFPSLEDGIEVRSGKIAWINANLPSVIDTISLTEKSAGGYALRHWNQAKDLDNLARKNAEAAKRQVEQDGKATTDMINKAVAATGEAFYEALYADLTACQDAFKLLDNIADAKFGDAAPSLAGLRNAIDSCLQVVSKIAKDKGMIAGSGEVDSNPSSGPQYNAATSAAKAGSRDEALRKLAEVAQYYKVNEPHSPVAYLVDRAAQWGRMTLDQWLKEVVKDQSQLQGLTELLGIKLPPDGS